MPYNVASDNLKFLGPGYAFFFDVVKFCLAVLLIMFLLSGLSNLVINSIYGDIADDYSNYVTNATIGRIAHSDGFLDVL